MIMNDAMNRTTTTLLTPVLMEGMSGKETSYVHVYIILNQLFSSVRR